MSRSLSFEVETRARRGLRAGPVAALDRWLLSTIARALGEAPLRLVLWDGTETCAGRSSPIGAIFFKDRRTLIGVARDPDFHVCDGAAEVGDDLRFLCDLCV